jgi:hypothetical protein
MHRSALSADPNRRLFDKFLLDDGPKFRDSGTILRFVSAMKAYSSPQELAWRLYSNKQAGINRVVEIQRFTLSEPKPMESVIQCMIPVMEALLGTRKGDSLSFHGRNRSLATVLGMVLLLLLPALHGRSNILRHSWKCHQCMNQ